MIRCNNLGQIKTADETKELSLENNKELSNLPDISCKDRRDDTLKLISELKL